MLTSTGFITGISTYTIDLCIYSAISECQKKEISQDYEIIIYEKATKIVIVEVMYKSNGFF